MTGIATVRALPADFQRPTALEQPVFIEMQNLNSMAEGFHNNFPTTLFSYDITPEDWNKFMTGMNNILASAPGSLEIFASNFWISRVATLGMSYHARRFTENRARTKAEEYLRQWNNEFFLPRHLFIEYHDDKMAFGVDPYVMGAATMHRHHHAARREIRREYRQWRFNHHHRYLAIVNPDSEF
ncbi:hypothetical protein BC937DRAFT_87235 [Endogone sp. FLAS-F59071]|nr:hypothetical protein BC937DRAFT_87235 [Endogone sp. FLAS-F59071]|eukprot:RUS12693.1 hypothetical protein BC937DRAFT_87235 [Endogone sp. FLAS-F59071]